MAQEAQLQLDLPKPHAGQREVLQKRKRFNVVACGRRWGKTTMLYILLGYMIAYNLTNRRHADIAVISPSIKNLIPIWHNFKKVFAKFIQEKSEKHLYVWILGKFKVEFWSIEQIELMRGRAYCLVLIDETALIKGLNEIWQAIIFSTLNDWMGSAWMFSTPKGFNDFYSFYQFGLKPLFSETWASFNATFLDNPHNNPDEYKLAKLQFSPDYFAQEYDAKFVSLGHNLFDINSFGDFTPANEYEGNVLFRVRYWDIANSENGDKTASVKLTITDLPRYYLGMPISMQGKWGNTYPHIKKTMLAEQADGVRQIIETEGVGGIAWQIVMTDPDLVGVHRFPADRRFTKESKYDRASLWALESQLGRVKIEKHRNSPDLLDKIVKFPYDEKDYIDSISGAFLSVNFLFGGYNAILKNISREKAKRLYNKDMPKYSKSRKYLYLRENSDYLH